MRATYLVLIGVSQIQFVLYTRLHTWFAHHFLDVFITVTVILCINGSINNDVWMSAYKAIVRPHLEYFTQASRSYRRRRATKIIPELGYLSYEECLNECNLTTIETRRLRGDQIEVFKIMSRYENIDITMFISLKKDSRTRRHEITLVKGQCRLDIRKYSLSQRTINEWNKLSTDCIIASSVNMF